MTRTAGGAPPLIWIVDDSQTGASITERALGPAYRYEVFGDGAALVARLQASERFPDLILLDWVMPGMTGDEVCRVLRADPRTQALSIIMLTASRVETQDIVHAIESGANDYVAKPFVIEELRARVSAVLREGRLKREASLERDRIVAINHLARALFEAGPNVEAILRAMTRALVGSLCDGCAVTLLPSAVPELSAAHHRDPTGAALLGATACITDPMVHEFETSGQALAALPAAYAPYIRACGLRAITVHAISARGLAHGVVTLTRDGGSSPFDPRDLAAIETCLDHTGLALEAAIRAEAERATMRFHEQMVGIVGHDLRTPLAAVAMGIELLRQPGSAVNEKVLRRLEGSTQRMMTIVDQLLDLTRARLGAGIPLAPRPVQLRPLVAGLLDELRLSHKGAVFELAGEDMIGMWDGDRLAQVVANLAANAVQYGRPGAPIRISLERAGGSARISVANALQDQPIPPGELAMLFDPFKRADKARKHAGGLGLGLYIVAEIVRAHHGTIEAESTRAGTVFRVILPMHGDRDRPDANE